MKRVAILAAIGALLLTDASFAQPPGQTGRPPDRGPSGNGGGPSGRPDHPSTLPAPGNPGRPNPGNPGNGHPDRPNPGGPNRPPNPGGPGMRPPPPRPPSVRPPPRPNRPQFSWRGRHYNPVYGPAFRYPPGYAYRRWSTGAFLPGLFLSTLYYYDDWRGLGIGAPPPGRRWVRYGPDLLLVNTHTRRVEDVIYGVFY